MWCLLCLKGELVCASQEEIALIESRYFSDESLHGLFRQYRYLYVRMYVCVSCDCMCLRVCVCMCMCICVSEAAVTLYL